MTKKTSRSSNGTYYGYFTADYEFFRFRASYIMRVPLGGGPPAVLAESPAYGGLGEIATDGATLFWIDYGSVRSMPINGGTVTTLVQGTGRILGGVYVTHISLAPDFVYYISNLGISRIPKSGGPVDQVYPAYSATALYVWSPTPSYSAVFWGDSEGVHSVDPEGMLYTWPQNGPPWERDVDRL